MRVMVMVKANKDSEAGIMPKQKKLLAEMGKFNEELVKAGVLLAAEGLQPTSKGKRVRFSGEKRAVIDLARPTNVCCIAILSSLRRLASLYLLVERAVGRSTGIRYFFEVSTTASGARFSW